MNVASVATASIKDLEMDLEQEVVWGNNNGLHWVNALMFFIMHKPYDVENSSLGYI